MRIIPAIDIIAGKSVRLSKGDYRTQKTYKAAPLDVAKDIEAHGMAYLHLVDLDGARQGKMIHSAILREICRHTNLKVDYGGGLKSTEDVQHAFDCGAYQVTAGSIARSNPELVRQWVKQFGPDKIILGADCYQRRIATEGWTNNSSLDVIDYIRDFGADGIRTVVCTDIERDGMLQGPSVALYKDILAAVPVELVASGGIASLQDLEQLKAAGCAGAIVGKAIHEDKITLKELRRLC